MQSLFAVILFGTLMAVVFWSDEVTFDHPNSRIRSTVTEIDRVRGKTEHRNGVSGAGMFYHYLGASNDGSEQNSSRD